MSGIISIDVMCPWCGAKSGERCTESDGRGGVRRLPIGMGHLGRVEPIPDEVKA